MHESLIKTIFRNIQIKFIEGIFCIYVHAFMWKSIVGTI